MHAAGSDDRNQSRRVVRTAMEGCGFQTQQHTYSPNSLSYFTTQIRKASALVIQECEEAREIPVPNVIMIELNKLYNRNAEYYIFSGKETPYEPRIALTHLKKFLARSGVRNVSFNELRDNFVQNCINNGCDIMMTARLLGTNSLNKLLDDFDWGEVPFDKTAEFVEMMGDRLVGKRSVQTKSPKAVTGKLSKNYQQSIVD